MRDQIELATVDLGKFDFNAEPRNARVPEQVRKAFNKTPWKEGYIVAQHNGIVLALTSELCMAESMLVKWDAHVYSSSPLGIIYKVI